jgi:hypothetical protein
MILGIAIEKTSKAATGCGVHNLIDPGKPEGIFFECLIKINIINTHPLNTHGQGRQWQPTTKKVSRRK